MGYRLTPDQAREMATAIRSNAARLGIDPAHFASIMSFETGGTLDPWKAGPTTKYGQHHGLIQWGGPQARQYGVGPNTSITDQVNAAGKYLYDRGVRPGMGLPNVYSAVLAGSATKGLHNRDKFGTSPASGAANMQRTAHAQALANLDRMSGGNAPAPVQYADQRNSVAFKNQFGGPAPVQTAAASPQQRANPQLDAALRQKPASTILERFNPISKAMASEGPSGLNRDRINSKDPSGPLLPAPVQAQPATPEQRAAPRMDPTAGSSYQDAAERMRHMWAAPAPMQNPTLDKLGMTYAPDIGGVKMPASAPYQLGPMGLSTDRVMFNETPSSVSMQQSQLTPFSPGLGAAQLPPIDVGVIPQGPGNGYQPATPGLATSVGPFIPDQEAPMVTPLTQETPPTITPETYADPGPSFTPDPGPSMADSMPSVGGDAGGGMGDMMSGLADALSNLGGGGEGGGQPPSQMPQGGGANALTMGASVPDFPRIGDQYAALLQQRGQQVDMPIGLPQTPNFSLKQIGQAGQQPDMNMEGFSRPAIKRLFTP